MLKIVKTTLCLMLALVAVAKAGTPKLITEGRLVYDISVEGEINPIMAAMMPKEMTMYIKNNKMRTEMTGTGWTNMIIADTKTRTSVALIDMMGNKRATRINAEDVDKNYEEHKPTINILKETKEIAGFKCNKAEIIDSKGNKSYVYYTKAIAARNGVNINLRDIDGFLMEYQNVINGITIKMTARGINGAYKVDDNMFLIPEGYTELTKDELQKMGK